MKGKIRIVDKTGSKEKVIEKEFNIRNLFHYEVSQKHRAQVFKDKTKYNRKAKHKSSYDYYFFS